MVMAALNRLLLRKKIITIKVSRSKFDIDFAKPF